MIQNDFSARNMRRHACGHTATESSPFESSRLDTRCQAGRFVNLSNYFVKHQQSEVQGHTSGVAIYNTLGIPRLPSRHQPLPALAPLCAPSKAAATRAHAPGKFRAGRAVADAVIAVRGVVDTGVVTGGPRADSDSDHWNTTS